MGRYVVNESLEGGVGKGSGVWSNAVFDCCGPPGGLNVCCYTCFCPCFAAAEVARAGGRNYWASWCCAMLPCCGGACTLAVDRDQLGQRFEVPELRTYCQSWCCMLWCQACHLAQMLNHYKRVVNSTIVGEDKRAAPLPRGTVVTQLLEARQVAGPAPHTATPAASASTAAKASKTHPTHTLQQTTDKTATRTRTQGGAGTALAVTQNQTSQFFVKPPAPQVGKAGGAVEAGGPAPTPSHKRSSLTLGSLHATGTMVRGWFLRRGFPEPMAARGSLSGQGRQPRAAFYSKSMARTCSGRIFRRFRPP
jgi:Cys-rich protein (TIGR01571 family)